MKKMANTRGNPKNKASLYHASEKYLWKIMVIDRTYFFVDEAGLCSHGYTQYKWTEITPSEAMVMKKADKIWGNMRDSGQNGKMWSKYQSA